MYRIVEGVVHGLSLGLDVFISLILTLFHGCVEILTSAVGCCEHRRSFNRASFRSLEVQLKIKGISGFIKRAKR